MTDNSDAVDALGGKCWFCGKNKPDPSYAIRYNLEKEVRISGSYSGTFRRTKKVVDVPSCKRCHELREKSNRGLNWIGFLVIGLFALFTYLLYTYTSISELLQYSISCVVALIIGVIIYGLIQSRIAKNESWTEEEWEISRKEPRNYPVLKALEDEGYKRQ